MNEMVCTSCNKQRKNLSAKRSALIKSMPLFLCNQCSEQGFEPRYVLVMAARNNGLSGLVADFLLKRRYEPGPKGLILAEELL